MQKTTGNKIKLGIFVATGIILFIAGIYYVGNKQQLFSSTFNISGIFKDINGLQVGNNVRFSGINIGVVNDISQITDSTVKVDLLINEDARRFIKKDAKAIIGSEGLMGNKNVLILRGTKSKKVLSDEDIIETVQPINLDDILLKVKETSDNTSEITSDLAIIMKAIREGKGAIGKLLMDSSFAGNVDKALVNIKQGAGGFKQNMDAASQNFLLKGFFKDKKKAKEEKILKAKKDKQELKDKQKQKNIQNK